MKMFRTVFEVTVYTPDESVDLLEDMLPEFDWLCSPGETYTTIRRLSDGEVPREFVDRVLIEHRENPNYFEEAPDA